MRLISLLPFILYVSAVSADTLNVAGQSCSIQIKCEIEQPQEPAPIPEPTPEPEPNPIPEPVPVPPVVVSNGCTMLTDRICKTDNSVRFRPVTGDGWKCDICPPWVSVSDGGEISGTPTRHGAEYVNIRSGERYATAIVIKGAKVHFMGPGEAIKSLQEATAYFKSKSSASPMQPGDVLIVRDGFYPDHKNDINNFNGDGARRWARMSGSPDKYSTLIAENPGKAIFGYMDIEPNARYINIAGIRYAQGVKIAGRSNYSQASHHVRMQQISASGGHISLFDGVNNILIEDFFVDGGSRAPVRVGSRVQDVVFRRGVIRHNWSVTRQPTASFMAYSSSGSPFDNITLQNVLFLDRGPQSNFAHSNGSWYGIIEAKNGLNMLIQDSLAISQSVNDECAPCYHVFNDGNQEPVQMDNVHLGGNKYRGAVDILNDYNGLSQRRGLTGAMPTQAGYDRLTSVSLWPWPMEQRIRREASELVIDDAVIEAHPRITVQAHRGFMLSPSLTEYVQSSQ